MDVYRAIKDRRSIRKFLDLPIEQKKISMLLDAGRFAPSAGNVQDWKFIVVVGDHVKKKVAEACLEQYWIGDAPLHIIVCSVPEKSKQFYEEKGEDFAALNAAAAIQNILLVAHELKLGSCWVSGFEERILKEALKIPDDVIPVAVIPLGYPDEHPPAPERLELHEVTFMGEWDKKSSDDFSMWKVYAEKIKIALAHARNAMQKVVKK